MRILKMMITAALAALALPLAAQQAGTSEMDILREKIRADRKLVVATNLELSEAQGKNFWPIYDAYEKELKNLNDRTLALIEDYAAAYNKGRVSNEDARALLKRTLALEDEETKMRRTYIGKAQRVLADVQVARWAQIENKLRAALKYDLASSIPLVK